MAADRLSDDLFQKYSRLAMEHCGINLHDGKKELLQARLNKRLRATGIKSYKEYYDYLTSHRNDEELVNFLDSISTNLTYFFREPKHFEFLQEVALPELIRAKQKAGNRRLRIWSAACSTGEEPYSVAMCVHSNLKDPERWDFRILATDISTRVLEIAYRGRYPEERVLRVPVALRQIYFRKIKENGGPPLYEIAPVLRDIVTIRRLNLNEPFPFKGPFDCIFCRNVMIYFNKETQRMLVHRMADYLAPGGYLMVGHSESLTGLDHPLRYIQPSIYQKI